MDVKPYPVTHTEASERYCRRAIKHQSEHGTERPGSCATHYEKRAANSFAPAAHRNFTARRNSRRHRAGRASTILILADETTTDRGLRGDPHRSGIADLRSHLGQCSTPAPADRLRYCPQRVAMTQA